LQWYVAQALDRFGRQAEAPLLARLEDKEYVLPVLALLGGVGSPDCVAKLSPLLMSEDNRVRVAAARALARLWQGVWQRWHEAIEEGTAAAARTAKRQRDAAAQQVRALRPALEATLKEKGLSAEDYALRVQWRLALAAALGELKGPAARQLLLWLAANDWEKSVRVAAAVAYGRSVGQPTSVIQALAAALREPDVALRLAAVGTLGREGKLLALPVLREAAENDGAQQVRVAARRAYKKITGMEYPVAGQPEHAP